MRRDPARAGSRAALAALFVGAGVMHFVAPRAYLGVMPPWVPLPLEAVYTSGIGEIVGGLGLLPAGTRRAAGVGLAVLLVAVFPANIHMALYPELSGLSPTLLWLRLPLQPLLIAWVLWASSEPERRVRPI